MAVKVAMDFMVSNERHVVLVRAANREDGAAAFAGLIAAGSHKVLLFRNNARGELLATFYSPDCTAAEYQVGR